MAKSISMISVVQGAVDTPNKLVSVQFNAKYSGWSPDEPRAGFIWGIGQTDLNGPIESGTGLFGFNKCGIYSNTYEYTPGNIYSGFVTQNKLTCDKNYQVKARVQAFFTCSWAIFLANYHSALTQFKSKAIDATASAPTSSGITQSGATIACNYFPNTDASTATVKLEYRKQGDTTWIQAGSADNTQGYNQLSISRVLTGLACATIYEFRLNIHRDTTNSQDLISSVSTFTTSACGAPAPPTIITNEASNIQFFSAQLNGTVNPNGTSTTYRFQWGVVSGGPYPNETALKGPESGTANIDFSDTIVTNPGTTYYFRAKATQSGTDYFGSEKQFTTPSFAPIPGAPPEPFKREDIPITYQVKSSLALEDKLHIEGSISGLPSGLLSFNRDIAEFKDYSVESDAVFLPVGDNLIDIPKNARYMLIVPTSSGEITIKGDALDAGVDRISLVANTDSPFLLPVDAKLQSSMILSPTIGAFTAIIMFI